MTTNFALSLSFDGIRLLHRVTDGWHLVGETGLEVEDLAAILTEIRDDALRIDPTGIRAKILIPDDQIKFVTLETAQTELADVMHALEGATPYPIDELAVDFDRNGGRTFIAAVARETLAEAEAFATEHGFTPVCFAAVPDALTFKSEVFFGPASGAGSDTIERDEVPVIQTGVAVIPPDPDAAPLFTPRPRETAPDVTPKPENTPPAAASSSETSKDADAAIDPVAASPVAPTIDAQTSNAPPVVDAPVVAAPTIGKAVVTPKPPALSTAAPVVSAPAAPAVSAPIIDAPKPVAPPAPEAAEVSDDLTKEGFFASRRKKKAAAAPVAAATQTRKEKKAAAFATKQAQPVRGKPRFLGLILTVLLIAFMGLVALWASTLSEEDVAGWFGFGTGGIVKTADAPPPEIVAAAQPIQPDVADATTSETAPIEAVLPQVRDVQTGRVLSPAEANRIYAATGVWQRAPRLPLEPRTDTMTATMPEIARAGFSQSQPQMPFAGLMGPDLALLAPVNPLPPGTDFDRNENGLVRATPQGALTPQGVLVFAGPPPRKPPLRAVAEPGVELAALPAPAGNGVVVVQGRPAVVPPLRPTDAALPAPEEAAPAVDLALAGLRPKSRPAGLAPAPAPVVDTALAGLRPKTRPAGLVPTAVAAPAPDITDVVAAIAEAAPVSPLVNPTPRAVAASSRPDIRPNNFARVVARAQDLQAQQDARASAAQPAAAVSNAPATPSGNVPGGVARAATYDNAIRLRDVNLIGVYGTTSSRRALVRLGNGRFVKVEVGSRLDGGRVTAIGDSVLKYVKRGQTISLQLPSG